MQLKHFRWTIVQTVPRGTPDKWQQFLKITFYRISRHFRSIRNFFFFFSQNDHRISRHFRSIYNFFKITFDRISRHFRPAVILDERKSLSIKFFAISDQYATFFYKYSHKMSAIMDERKSFSIAFLTISDQYATFFCIFFQDCHQRHFG